jgi:hypothetical protein
MSSRVVGQRLGVLIHLRDGRFVRNGEIADADRSAVERMGYRIAPCRGVPQYEPTEDEREAIERAKVERANRRSAGALMRELTAPLRKPFHIKNDD